VQALKYLRHFQRSDYAGARRARPAPQVQSEVEALLQHYITYLLERALNSPAFLRQIKK
jgi:DNA repair protein RecO (recombination protein O)